MNIFPQAFILNRFAEVKQMTYHRFQSQIDHQFPSVYRLQGKKADKVKHISMGFELNRFAEVKQMAIIDFKVR